MIYKIGLYYTAIELLNKTDYSSEGGKLIEIIPCGDDYTCPEKERCQGRLLFEGASKHLCGQCSSKLTDSENAYRIITEKEWKAGLKQ